MAAPGVPLRMHFHDTRNTGLANAFASVEAGVDILDASCGGLGGCPFAPDATGNIGTIAVAQSPADGCTLLNNAAVIATFTASFAKLGYDPLNDLIPIGGIGITPTLLVTAAGNPVSDLKGLIAESKSKPDGLNFSTAGYGLLQHLAVEEIAARSAANSHMLPTRAARRA